LPHEKNRKNKMQTLSNNINNLGIFNQNNLVGYNYFLERERERERERESM
jgi:hypothetical protein